MSYEAEGHAARTPQSIHSEKMASNRLQRAPVDVHEAHPRDEVSVTLGPSKQRAKIDKQSLSYVVRSGIAGGVAGTRYPSTKMLSVSTDNHSFSMRSEDCRGTFGQGEDPIPN